jgi:hypothetical protein
MYNKKFKLCVWKGRKEGRVITIAKKSYLAEARNAF